MGAMFRSEKMALCQLFIQPEAAYQSVAELGEMGTVQFRDLNCEVNSFQRKFVSEVRRCDELERKLRYIEAELIKDGVTAPDIQDEVPKAPNPREIIDLEAHLEKTESEILELSNNAVGLKNNFLELTELKHVLEKTQVFFQEQEGVSGSDSLTRALITEDPAQTTIRGRLGFVAGVVPRERVPAFERMLWRISRGNVFLRQAEIEHPLEDPSTGNAMFKTVFVAFFQGEQLKSRVKKICSGFHASIYNCPNTPAERHEMVGGVRTRIEDLNMILNQTKDHRHRVLMSVSKELRPWMVMVKKMKAIYHALNMFNMDVTKKCLIAECWVPVGDMTMVRQALVEGGVASGSSIPSFLNVIETAENPPTFNRVNKFTRGFQNLIDSYGVANYREVNPALYTIISFPFLFAVMFGDMGHGLIMTLFGAFMVLREKTLAKAKISSEIWTIFFAGRYIILLMGLFSIYTGFIYNDVFSKSMNVFQSSWRVPYNESTVQNNSVLTLDPANGGYLHQPYPIGLDPVWQLAQNKIIFLNSYKMKLSIIFGVLHMIFGVCLSVVNHVHSRNKVRIFLEFLPQVMFLVLLFGWMVVMMFLKWVWYSPANIGTYSPYCAPSVLIMFINMMLFKSTPPLPNCEEFMFEGQKEVQMVCVLVALVCIPWMLLGTPLYVLFTRKGKKSHSASNGDVNQGLELQGDVMDAEQAGSTGTGNEEEEPMSEIYIHQAIHTIEYVLSTVSHTASYLRLWALSLAHAQLSDVLWNMVLHMSLSADGYIGAIMIYIIFACWSVLSLSILVGMEGLSAFLHTLRLHWVEFMSKFYVGQGYAFQPFSFKLILEGEDEVE